MEPACALARRWPGTRPLTRCRWSPALPGALRWSSVASARSWPAPSGPIRPPRIGPSSWRTPFPFAKV
eukprot:8950541-Lingulodinium_polyedra.AAC.1